MANTIEQNYIGLYPDGSVKANQNGVAVLGENNLIRNNVISGNQVGILIQSSGQTIHGNRIGTNPAGTGATGNGQGIWLLGSAHETQIGGTMPGQGNLISGNTDSGIHILSNNNDVFGNFIGTNYTGTEAIANYTGIDIWGMGNAIGGMDEGSGNLISGNDCGIALSGEGNIIRRNLIGTSADGASALPNNTGIEVFNNQNAIGSGGGNTISFNTEHGIIVYNAMRFSIRENTLAYNGGAGVYSYYTPEDAGLHGTRVRISRNSFYRNGDLGILFLAPDYNHGIQPPEIRGPSLSNIHGIACPDCLVEIYVADLDPTGFGEGKTFLSSTTADEEGEFSAPLTGLRTCGWITATATDEKGNSSPFSRSQPAGICLYMPPLIALIWLTTSTLLGGALVIIIRRPRGLPSPGRAVLGGLLGLGIGYALLLLPIFQTRPQFEAVEQHAVESLRACDSFIDPQATTPLSGAMFYLGEDPIFSLVQQPDLEDMQIQWHFEITDPQKRHVVHAVSEPVFSLSDLELDATILGLYTWRFSGERMQGQNQWSPFCEDKRTRTFLITLPDEQPVLQVTTLPDSEPSATPPLPEPSPTPTSGFPLAAFLQNANCRKGPEIGYEIVTSMLEGQTAFIEGRNQENTWWWVRIPQSQNHCWVADNVIRITGPLNGLPIIQALPLPSPTSTPAQGCWVWNANLQQNECIVPCPPNPQPGGACTP